MEEIEFVECSDCAKKPGTPVLCNQCLAIRHVVGMANKAIRDRNDLKAELNEMRKTLVKAITEQMKGCKKCLKRSTK